VQLSRPADGQDLVVHLVVYMALEVSPGDDYREGIPRSRSELVKGQQSLWVRSTSVKEGRQLDLEKRVVKRNIIWGGRGGCLKCIFE
jgi:hypothetical protein